MARATRAMASAKWKARALLRRRVVGESEGDEEAIHSAASGKRKRAIKRPPVVEDSEEDEEEPEEEDEEEQEEGVVKRKCGLDFDILECPICFENFSPPVFQCQNGHTACSACCKQLADKKCPSCSQPTGTIRCIAIEKILDSLLVSCKYAENGCKEMLKRSEIAVHERGECEYEPFSCPVRGCSYKCSETTLPGHLTEKHRVKTVALNNIHGAGFVMKSSDRIVMVKSDDNSLLHLVHRELEEKLGDVFFCTRIRGSCRRVDLKVAFCSDPSICLSVTGATAEALREKKVHYYQQHFLMLPFIQPAADAQRPVEVHVSVSP